MYIAFDCNHQIFKILFLQFELSHFVALLLSKNIDAGNLVNAFPPTLLRETF